MLSLKPRRRARLVNASILIFILCAVTFLTYKQLYSDFPLGGGGRGDAWENAVETASSNSTLGFGRIYVVSQNESPRRESIIQAANVTELDLDIPDQPVWTKKDENNFRLKKGSTVGKGSLLAWFGHLHVLRQFLASGAETALFLEDDVDWDIRLRTTQTPLVSKAIRKLVGLPRLSNDAQEYPYGDPDSWDLLYLGHCGDYFHGMDIGFKKGHVKPKDLSKQPHVAFADPTMLRSDYLHPFTESTFKGLGVDEYTRLVHKSVFPLCTFGYALSRAGALRLLEMGSTEPAGKGHKAYDVLILLGCRDYGMRCWTVNPELFHHMPGLSIIDTEQGNTELPPVDEAAMDQVDERRETPNIDCGFWGGAFGFDDDDTEHLDWLREEVGRKGRCLKSGKRMRIPADDQFTD